MFEKRLKEINARRAEIRALLESDAEADIDELTRELDALDREEASLISRRDAVARLNRSGEIGGHGDRGSGDGPTPGPVNPIIGRSGAHGEAAGGGLPSGVNSRAAYLADLQGIRVDDAEARAAQFVTEQRMTIQTDALRRSLTLSSGNIAQPSRVSGINAGQNLVSGIVDMVYIVDANGMGEDSVAYEVSGGQKADIKKDDGSVTPESTPTLKIAKITPVLVSTLSYVSRNIRRTTPLNYQARVSDSSLAALRQKTGGLIVTGNPAAAKAEITGILKAAAIDSGTDLEIVSIDHTTLRKIALKYGGAANVEGGGVLLLNKEDLIAFGDIRGKNELKPVYEIEFSEASTTTGTIKDGGLTVRFCIVDDLPALSAAATAAGSYSMCYGKPYAYQLDLFGPYEVSVSEGYKFGEGLLTVMGEAMIGGNVITENGFIRVKKKAGA